MSREMQRGIIGVAIGVAIALLFMFVGFWRTLLIALCGGIGWWLASGHKIPKVVWDLIDKIKQSR